MKVTEVKSDRLPVVRRVIVGEMKPVLAERLRLEVLTERQSQRNS